ncbi:hypothetical protein CGRA01v4_08011 [Colletotrichum graminicola]|nr:hypothetical protein CGRA01v4_08011 [Colletotrichum graminicola]
MSEQAMDDVSKFLQDVKEMNARRTEEDDARQRELDEKIQQEKRERQARRAGTSLSFSYPPSPPPPSLLSSIPRPASICLCSFSLPPSALFMCFLFLVWPRKKILIRVLSCHSACLRSCWCRAMSRFSLPSTRDLSY